MQRSLQEEADAPETSPARLQEIFLESPGLSLHLAQNPSCPPALLAQISQRATEGALQVSLLKAVMKNPNAPLSVLLRWAASLPKEFLENPALPLYLLEDPSLYEQLSEDALRALAKLPEAPEELMRLAAKSWSCQESLAENPNLPTALIEELGQSTNPEPRLKRRLARHPNVPPQLIERFANDPSPSLRYDAAQRLAPEKLRLLIRAGSSPGLSRFDAPDLSLSSAELRQLSQGGHWSRVLVACHPNTPARLAASIYEEAEHDTQALIRAYRKRRSAAPKNKPR